MSIDRNEGKRLRRWLESIRGQSQPFVSVYSGSQNGSVELGRSLASAVVKLDLSIAFTTARARNYAFEILRQIQRNLEYVLFVDGDGAVVSGSLPKALGFLTEQPDITVVSVLRRERHSEKSIYNLLCDMELKEYFLGETQFCSGNALIRIDALRQYTRYRPELICGAEPDMCVRLRQAD